MSCQTFIGSSLNPPSTEGDARKPINMPIRSATPKVGQWILSDCIQLLMAYVQDSNKDLITPVIWGRCHKSKTDWQVGTYFISIFFFIFWVKEGWLLWTTGLYIFKCSCKSNCHFCNPPLSHHSYFYYITCWKRKAKVYVSKEYNASLSFGGHFFHP